MLPLAELKAKILQIYLVFIKPLLPETRNLIG